MSDRFKHLSLTDRSVKKIIMSPRTPEQNEQIRAESKHRIMEAAFKLIAKKGYDSTSIAGIAKEAGVAKGLLYNYFDSKEDLVKELVLSAMDEGDKLMGEMEGKEPNEVLQLLIMWFFREMRERPEHWRLLTELTIKKKKFDFVHNIVIGKMLEYIDIMAALLGQMGYEDPIGEARVIAALFDGIGIEILIAREDYPLDEMEKYLLKKYCNE